MTLSRGLPGYNQRQSMNSQTIRHAMDDIEHLPPTQKVSQVSNCRRRRGKFINHIRYEAYLMIEDKD